MLQNVINNSFYSTKSEQNVPFVQKLDTFLLKKMIFVLQLSLNAVCRRTKWRAEFTDVQMDMFTGKKVDDVNVQQKFRTVCIDTRDKD
jgi:hypothetical protein